MEWKKHTYLCIQAYMVRYNTVAVRSICKNHQNVSSSSEKNSSTNSQVEYENLQKNIAINMDI